MQLSKFWWMAVARREKHTGFEQELRNIKKTFYLLSKSNIYLWYKKYFLKISNSLSYHFLRKSTIHLHLFILLLYFLQEALLVLIWLIQPKVLYYSKYKCKIV